MNPLSIRLCQNQAEFDRICTLLSTLGKGETQLQIVPCRDNPNFVTVASLPKPKGFWWLISWISHFCKYKPEHQRIRSIAEFSVDFFRMHYRKESSHQFVLTQSDTIEYLYSYFKGIPHLGNLAERLDPIRTAYQSFAEDRILELAKVSLRVAETVGKEKGAQNRVVELINSRAIALIRNNERRDLEVIREIKGLQKGVKGTSDFLPFCYRPDCAVICVDGAVKASSCFLKLFPYFATQLNYRWLGKPAAVELSHCPKKVLESFFTLSCGAITLEEFDKDEHDCDEIIWLYWLRDLLGSSDLIDDVLESPIEPTDPSNFQKALHRHKAALMPEHVENPPFFISPYEEHLLAYYNSPIFLQKPSKLSDLMFVCKGMEAEEDISHIFDLIKYQASQRNTDAILTLANCHWFGVGMEQDRKSACALYESASLNTWQPPTPGDTNQLLTLANMYMKGEEIAYNPGRALDLYEKALIPGSTLFKIYMALFRLVPDQLHEPLEQMRILQDMILTTEFKDAIRHFPKWKDIVREIENNAYRGAVETQYFYASLHHNAILESSDIEQAIGWYEKIATNAKFYRTLYPHNAAACLTMIHRYRTHNSEMETYWQAQKAFLDATYEEMQKRAEEDT